MPASFRRLNHAFTEIHALARQVQEVHLATQAYLADLLH